MNELLQSIFLGVIQGLTEFLPVSSSGHLVLAQQALGASFDFADNAVVFDLVLHAGTLLPVLWFYRGDLIRILQAFGASARATAPGKPATAADDRTLAWHVVLATIPTGLIGILFKDTFEALFHSVGTVCLALAATGGLLLLTKVKRTRSPTPVRLTAGTALLIGLVQGLAITPGISRSGSTIAVALLLGMERQAAARFSFLLSIPAICGAIVLQLKDGLQLGAASLASLIAGFASSMVVGYFALVLLVALVRRGDLHRFTYYLWPAAALAYVFLG